MSTEYDRDELLSLLNRLTVGTLEPAEHDRLEEILKEHPAARKDYFAFLDVDLGLKDMALGWSAEIPPPIGLADRPTAAVADRRSRSPAAFAGYALVAGLTALATGLLLFIYTPRLEGPSKEPAARNSETLVAAPDDVATLVFTDACRWHAETGRLVEGQRLPTGVLYLLRGMAPGAF